MALPASFIRAVGYRTIYFDRVSPEKIPFHEVFIPEYGSAINTKGYAFLMKKHRGSLRPLECDPEGHFYIPRQLAERIHKLAMSHDLGPRKQQLHHRQDNDDFPLRVKPYLHFQPKDRPPIDSTQGVVEARLYSVKSADPVTGKVEEFMEMYIPRLGVAANENGAFMSEHGRFGYKPLGRHIMDGSVENAMTIQIPQDLAEIIGQKALEPKQVFQAPSEVYLEGPSETFLVLNQLIPILEEQSIITSRP